MDLYCENCGELIEQGTEQFDDEGCMLCYPCFEKWQEEKQEEKDVADGN